jgi:hypothetical protein
VQFILPSISRRFPVARLPDAAGLSVWHPAARYSFRAWGPIWAALFFIGIAPLLPPALRAQDCLDCHSSELDPQRPALTIAAEDFTQSVHGALGCKTCHSDVRKIPHENVKLPECATCHAEQAKAFASSVHGRARARGDRDAATCQNCHGPTHAIKAVRDPASSVYPLTLPRTCGACHGNPELAKKHGIPVANAYQLFMDSIHGRAISKSGLLVAANCSSCHGSHDILPETDPASKVYRANIPSTCGACHAGVLNVYSGSVHGEAVKAGNQSAAVCIDCHTTHEISRVETETWKLAIVKECGTCHRQSLRTYGDTFHGQVSSLGFTRVARCSDCHGSHNIYRVADARSTVAAGNRLATCRKCHAEASANFLGFMPHADPKDRSHYPGLFYMARFMNVLILGVFSFFGLHTVLWFFRSLGEMNGRSKPRTKPEKTERKE